MAFLHSHLFSPGGGGGVSAGPGFGRRAVCDTGDQRYSGVCSQHSSLSSHGFESDLVYLPTVTWNRILGNVV